MTSDCIIFLRSKLFDNKEKVGKYSVKRIIFLLMLHIKKATVNRYFPEKETKIYIFKKSLKYFENLVYMGSKSLHKLKNKV